MFAGKLFASVAAFAALATPIAANAGDAKVVTTAVTSSITQTGKAAKPLPAKLYLVSVDTSDCFEGGSAAEDFARNCSTLAGSMPESRRIPSIKSQVEKVLCPRVESIDADGKKSSSKVCRTDLTVAKINSLNPYQVVSLAYQLDIIR